MRLLSVAAAVLAGLSPVALLEAAPVPKEIRKATLVGTWKVVKLTIGGKVEPDLPYRTFTFRADGTVTTAFTGGEPAEWKYAVEAKATSGRATWFDLADSPRFACLFAVAGDTLRFGFVDQGADPPAAAEPGPTLTLYEMTRVKDAE